MEQQLILLVASLAVQTIMAVALSVVGLIARRSLASIDKIQEKLALVEIALAGNYYSREDHQSFVEDLNRRMETYRMDTRESLHDLRDELHNHEVDIQLIAQHAGYSLPSARGRGERP